MCLFVTHVPGGLPSAGAQPGYKVLYRNMFERFVTPVMDSPVPMSGLLRARWRVRARDLYHDDVIQGEGVHAYDDRRSAQARFGGGYGAGHRIFDCWMLGVIAYGSRHKFAARACWIPAMCRYSAMRKQAISDLLERAYKKQWTPLRVQRACRVLGLKWTT